jgi:hypothetical protein
MMWDGCRNAFIDRNYLLHCSAVYTRKAIILEKWLSLGTPPGYLQRLLSRQKLLAL